MRSKLNRMMARNAPPSGLQMPPKQKRPLRIVDNTKPLQRAPEAAAWLVVMVEPRCEGKAIISLHEAGHLAWHPQMTVWSTNHRLRIKSKEHRPVFPRYIFVAKGERATKSVLACDHITYLVSSLPRSSTFMEELSERQHQGWADIKPVSPFKIDQEVVINDEGVFHGLSGIVEKTDADRTTILFDILGSMTKIEVDTDHLKRVA